MTTPPEGAVCCVLCSVSAVPGVVRESWVVTFSEVGSLDRTVLALFATHMREAPLASLVHYNFSRACHGTAKKHRYVSLPPAPPPEGQHETPVAVCINGVARTLHLPIVYRSLAQNLLRPLGAGVVSFASLTMHELHSVETGFNGGHEVVHAERRSLEVALEALNVSNANRRLRREDPSREELLGLLANAPRCLGRHIRRSVDLVRTHEAQHLRDGFRKPPRWDPDAERVGAFGRA